MSTFPIETRTAVAHSTAHDVAERDRLIRAFDYAEVIRSRPSLVEDAKALVSRSVGDEQATLGHRLWARVLDENVEDMLRFMTSDQPEGRLLRSNNPFSRLIGTSDPARRRQTWLQARSEL